MPLMYVDPGSGALIWQALVAGAFGVLFTFRRAVAFTWVRIVKRIRRLARREV